jgi:hypothetical protein
MEFGTSRKPCRRVWVVALLVLALGVSGSASAHSRARVAFVGLPQSRALHSLPVDAALDGHSYGWPLRPFDRPHVIRGAFGDPRFGLVQRNFHFGIDIPAAPYTPVYAVAPGTVFLEPDHVDVLVRSMRWRRGFSYWHIYPAVGEHVFVRTHTLLGWVRPRWGHLHFAELWRNRWVNPARPGALTPNAPATRPRIDAVTIAHRGRADASAIGASDLVDVIVEASAGLPLPPPGSWEQARVAPSLLRWRLLEHGRAATAWTVAVDFRDFIPPNTLYHDVYASGTNQNRPNRPGTYRFYLARNWDLATLPQGDYQLQVEAFGSAGAVARAATTLSIGKPAFPARS